MATQSERWRESVKNATGSGKSAPRRVEAVRAALPGAREGRDADADREWRIMKGRVEKA